MKKILLLGLIVTGMSFAASSARADGFSFSLSLGLSHHRPPVYVAPPPPVYVPPAVVYESHRYSPRWGRRGQFGHQEYHHDSFHRHEAYHHQLEHAHEAYHHEQSHRWDGYRNYGY